MLSGIEEYSSKHSPRGYPFSLVSSRRRVNSDIYESAKKSCGSRTPNRVSPFPLFLDFLSPFSSPTLFFPLLLLSYRKTFSPLTGAQPENSLPFAVFFLARSPIVPYHKWLLRPPTSRKTSEGQLPPWRYERTTRGKIDLEEQWRSWASGIIIVGHSCG